MRADMRQVARAVGIRAFCLVLSLLAAVGLCLPGRPALAQGVTFREHFFSDTPARQAYYFDILGTLGIVRGESGLGGPARPSEPVTRAEFAVMVARLLALDPGRSGPDLPPVSFGDEASIPAWAAEAVSACSALGIIKGVPGEAGGVDFRPGETVSGGEAVAMLLRALGNDTDVTGGWPSGFIYRAFQTGLLSPDVGGDDWRFVEPLGPLTRAQTAYLIHNALFCWRDFDPGEPEKEDDASFSTPPIGAGLGGHSLIADADLAAGLLRTAEGNTLRLAPTLVASGVAGEGELVGRRVYWLRDRVGFVAYIRAYASEPPVTGVFGALVVRDDGAGVEAVVLESGQVVPCAPGAVVELNGRRWPFDPAVVLPTAEVTAVLEGGRAVYVSIIQEDLPEGVIRSLRFEPASYEGGPTTGRITAGMGLAGGEMVLRVTPDTEIYLDGEPVDFSELRERDIFYAATEGSAPKRALRVYAYRDRVTGRVESVGRRYTAEGPHWQVTVLPDGADETVTLTFSPFCEGWVSTALDGRTLTFCLDRWGRVAFFGEPGPLPGGPVTVKVLRRLRAGGSDLLTVDWKGSEFTYLVPAGAETPPAGSLARLHVAPGGVASQLEPARPALFEATVVSVDADDGRLTLTTDSLTWTLCVGRVPLYAVDDAGGAGPVGAHVALSDLTEGVSVRLTDPAAPEYILVLQPEPSP